ncbi:unnamed protein product [Calypogeia fissa]
MHSDDENVKECRKGSCEMVFKDLEAGLPMDVASSVDEEGMHGVDLVEDHKCSSLVETTKEAVPVEAYDHDAASCDMKYLVDSELREPLLANVQTDNTKSSQDKEVLLGGENKVGGDSLEKESEVHGPRKRRGAKADAVKALAGGDSGLGKMPDEYKKGVIISRSKDAPTDVSQEAKQKPVDKKAGKQGKSAGKPSTVKKMADPPPLEESRAKEEAEANRKVHESLDNFIRQTIRCEPYMNFTSRPGDKPLQRLRPDVFENHVAGKFARGFKIDSGSDPRDIATEENRGMHINSNDVDGMKDGSTGSAKGISGLRTGAQHSLKVPPGVVAFTQSTSKGSDLQGWLSPSKTKCEKCAREFCSTLNYRRHVRVHRRSLNPEKEDLSKERSKVAAFWDKLNPEEANNILHCDNMEIEDLSGQAALEALQIFINQPGLPSLPQGILKAGALLLDIVRGYVPLSSERLLAILDDASEKTFLCGGTSVALQRFIFNGEAGKVGLEERNLVATMGFHIELNLVKAWMADKEAEALRCQQALFKEEEAAQQKRKKLLEKKRMKKIRQKGRKGTTSQLILQELENESIDDEGNVQGIGEEDDSPTGTGSSSSSLVSAHDLALPESAELDEADALTHNDVMDEHELVLGDKSDTGKYMSSDDDHLHRSPDGLSQYGRERQQIGGHRGEIESLYREEDPFMEAGPISQSRPADQMDWDNDFDSGPSHPYPQRGSGRTGEAQFNPYYRKGEQDRIGSDFKRRDFERPGQDRKPLRITRERSRNDYPEQKPLRDSRGYDGRYGDNHPTSFKPLRKPNAYFVKADSGNSDLSTRLQQYRSKLPGMNRTSSSGGNTQVVWTRKVPQPAAVEVPKDGQDETARGDGESSKGDGRTASELPEAVLSVPDIAPGDFANKLDEGRTETNDDAATPVPLEDSRSARSGDDLISAEEIPEVDDGLSGALLVGSLSVPLGKFATVSTSQARPGSSAALHRADDFEVRNVSAAGTHDESHGLQDVINSLQEARLSSHVHTATGSSDCSEPLEKCVSTSPRASNPSSTQSTNLKSQFSSRSPERGESSRHVAPPLGNERLAVKPGSWQTSAGRYIHAKVWRAVGMVGERQEFNSISGDSSSGFSEARPSQDIDSSGRSEGERDTSPTADVWQGSPTRDADFVRGDSEEGDDFEDGRLKSKSQLMSTGKAVNRSEAQSDDGVENASGQGSSSVFVDAGTFLNERWRSALAHASDDEVLLIPSDNISNEPEGFNFLDMVSRQISENSRQTPGAESGPSPSSSRVAELSGNAAQGEGVSLSKVFSDFDHTGMEDIICPLTTDEQALDGASPHSHSSEDDTGMRDASTSPLGSEHNMSGSETASSASLAREETISGSGGGGGGSGRRGNSKQDRWHRNSRDRFPEQRYMARRRAPAEKNSSATRF